MMRALLLCGLGLGATAFPTWAQTNSAPVPEAPAPAFDYNSPAELQVPGLHAAWLAEQDHAKRSALADQLVQAVIHEYKNQQPDIIDEVARDGLPKEELTSPAPVQAVTLHPLTTLEGGHSNPDDYPRFPVMRRITANRFEAWTPKEGWLFDGKGKMLAQVNVPRRDGTGREWFGAFLPDGRWITTDLWQNDEQLNGFSSTGKWLWELKGKTIVAGLPKQKPLTDPSGEELVPAIGWARADKTGQRWLVCVGFDYTRRLALVGPGGTVHAVSEDASPWKEVYPRSMGVRGMYTSLDIDSDDGKLGLNRSEAAHGVGVGWPAYHVSGAWNTVIPGGNEQFGFWPRSHDVYIEADGADWQGPHRLWFFTTEGKYQGEMTGSELGDAANGRDLLVRNASDGVAQVQLKTTGPVFVNVRHFTWPDGTTAVPLAIYDDLQAGFFLRGAGMQGTSDDVRKARAAAEVVVAKW
jgi:hypothetical protein